MVVEREEEKEKREKTPEKAPYTRQLRAAAISRQGASPRSGAINEVPVKAAALLLYQ